MVHQTEPPQPAYIDIAKRKQAERASRIPKEWILSNLPNDKVLNVMDFPRTCGLLSSKELEITETYDAAALVDALKDRKYTATEVAKAFCKRAAIAHQLTNCLTEIFFEDALARASFLDKHMEKTGKPFGPLHGIPVSIKDSFFYPGYDASIGLATFCFQTVTETAPIVKMLLKAGAILYVKTNVPQTLMALDTMNNIFGRTVNPWNRKLTAGGSTGGEGPLIALRGSLLGVGTDVGGSIRIPAACNGIYGLKPCSHRIIPSAGLRSASRPGTATGGVMVSTGPLATSLRSCELFMSSILDQKPWQIDPTVTYCPWRSFSVSTNTSTSTIPKKLNFLILPTDLNTVPLPPILSLLHRAQQKLSSFGHTATLLSNPPAIIKITQRLCNALLGIDGGTYAMDLLTSTSEPKVPWISTRLKHAPPKPLQHLFALGVQRVDLQRELLATFWADEKVDAIIMPVFPHPVTRHDEFNSANFTMMWNLLDWPAVSIPAGTVGDEDIKMKLTHTTAISSWDEANRKIWTNVQDYLNTPLALQIIGRPMQEEELLHAAIVVDQIINPGGTYQNQTTQQQSMKQASAKLPRL